VDLTEASYWFIFWILCGFKAILHSMVQWSIAWIFGGAIGVGYFWQREKRRRSLYCIPIGKTPDGRTFSLEFEEEEP